MTAYGTVDSKSSRHWSGIFHDITEESLLSSKLDTEDDTTRVAVMLVTDCLVEEGEGTVSEACAKMREQLKVLSEEDIKFFEHDRKLFVVSMMQSSEKSASEFMALAKVLGTILKDVGTDNYRMWPLHTPKHQYSLAAADISGGILDWLQLYPLAASEVTVVTALHESYGSRVAYTIAWTRIFSHRLWGLAIICSIAMLAGASPDNGMQHSKMWWYALIASTFAWGGALSWSTGQTARHPLLALAVLDDKVDDDDDNEDAETWSEFMERMYRMTYIVYPPCCLYLIAVTCILVSIIQLKLWLAYSWGDCLELRKTGTCLYPTRKHGLIGWLAQTSANIFLAAVFLLIGPLAHSLAKVLSYHMGITRQKTRQLRIHISTFLELLGKVGTFVLLGLVFVPKWVRQEGIGIPPCSGWGHAIFGDTWLECLHNEITVTERRKIFSDCMVGPFVVAPILVLLMKGAVPWLSIQFDRFNRSYTDSNKCCNGMCDALARILALLFSYDGEHVGGIEFVYKGWPYEKVINGRTQLHTTGPLQQGAKEEFDCLRELFFLKISWLWVLFFTPVLPWGIFPTVASWIVEARTKLRELLWVRRRPFVKHAVVPHITLRQYMHVILGASTLWWAGLAALTYNDESHRLISPGELSW